MLYEYDQNLYFCVLYHVGSQPFLECCDENQSSIPQYFLFFLSVMYILFSGHFFFICPNVLVEIYGKLESVSSAVRLVYGFLLSRRLRNSLFPWLRYKRANAHTALLFWART